MKKIKISILWFFFILTMAIEFVYSVLVIVVDAIGTKINELADTMETVYKEAK